MKFRDVKIGQWFDFIGPDPMMNSFTDRCHKTRERYYEWQCSCGRVLSSTVGSIDVEVYHVSDTE